MKSSFSGNILLQGIWEAELLKLKTYVSVKLNSQIVVIAVVTVFHQHAAAGNVLRILNKAMQQQTSMMHVHLLQYQYHLISTLHLLLEILKLLLRYNSNLRFHQEFLLELKVLYVPMRVQKTADIPVSAMTIVQQFKLSCRGNTLKGPERGALLSLLGSSSKFSIGATNERTALS